MTATEPSVSLFALCTEPDTLFEQIRCGITRLECAALSY